MTMGLKYNVIQCSQPQEIVQMTLNHLDSVAKLVSDSESAKKLIDLAVSNICQRATEFTLYDWNKMRSKLLDFLQDRNIKVSLFLNASLQSRHDGSFVIEVNDVPLGFAPPGQVIIYSEAGEVASQEQIASHPCINAKENNVNHLDTTFRSSNHGFNCYIDQKKLEDEAKEKGILPSNEQDASSATATTVTHAPRSTYYNPSTPIIRKKTATNVELNYLAKLIGVEKNTTSSKGTFKIEHLFPEARAVVENDEGKPVSYELHFDEKPKNAALESLMNEFSSVTVNDKSGTQGEEVDDLLSLMDNA
jgi:hypothetical protein